MPKKDITSKLAVFIRSQLAEGFEAESQILDEAIEVFRDECDPTKVQALFPAVFEAESNLRIQDQRTWPEVTDCDRLDAAFEDLNAVGIMARHNWTCCGNCGQSEMPDEFNRLEGRFNGKPIVGYTFYHMQDTEGAATGGGLYLYYGSTERAESEADYIDQCMRIALMIKQSLESNGLRVTWDGSYETRILVNLAWQRRHPPANFYESDSSDACGQ